MSAGDFLARMAALLDAAGVPYMIAGSFASTFHGIARATQDLDLVIDPASAALDSFLSALDPDLYYVDTDTARDALRRRSQFNVIDMATAWKADLIIRKARPFSVEEFARRQPVELLGTRTYVATAEDSIIAKLEWAKQSDSTRQLRDVAGIVAMRESALDLEYALGPRPRARGREGGRDDLLRLQLQKERLTAFVVHDLKNPVNSMDLHAQLLLREKGLSARALESAMSIRAEARMLARMIHNLLDLSKADEGKLAPKRSDVDLRLLVDEVIAELRVQAQSRAVDLRSCLGTGRIHADEDLLRRTLTNLVENAIRYAPSETSVTIVAARLAGGTDLRVTNAGTAIPPEMREKVFDPFVQVESSERVVPHGSRGLGLTFCRLVVEAHGGRIWIEDAAPGTTFCVRLPHDPEEAWSGVALSRPSGTVQ